MRIFLKLLVLLSATILFLTANVMSQDTLVYLNGKMLIGKVVSPIYDTLKEESVKILLPKKEIQVQKQGSNKIKTIKSEKLFSILQSDHKEAIIYRQDTINEMYYTEGDERIYIQGLRDAMLRSHSLVLNHSTLVITYIGYIGIQWWAVAVTPACIALAEFIPPKITVANGADVNLLTNDIYRQGFDKGARKKRVRSMFVFGYAGFLAGLGTNIILAQ